MLKRLLISLLVALSLIGGQYSPAQAQANGSSQNQMYELPSVTALTTDYLIPATANMMRIMAYIGIEPQKGCDAARLATKQITDSKAFYLSEKTALAAQNKPTTTLDQLAESIDQLIAVIPQMQEMACTPEALKNNSAPPESKAMSPVLLHLADAMDHMALGLRADLNGDETSACLAYLKSDQDLSAANASIEDGKALLGDSLIDLNQQVNNLRAQIQDRVATCKVA